MLNVIILAGDQEAGKWNDKQHKALLRINGKSMIEYVIDAFKIVECIDKVVVVGCKPELEEYIQDKVSKVLDAEGSIMDNIQAGINYLGFGKPVIVSSCDIPMITAEAINDFIDKAKTLDVDFCYPIVEKKVNESKYPEFERTYVKIKEGTYTGGNIFYLNPGIINKSYDIANKLLEARKNPFKMAGIISPGFLAQLVLGGISIPKLEKKFSDILGVKAKALISQYPEIGNDVDKPGDVIIATAHLSRDYR